MGDVREADRLFKERLCFRSPAFLAQEIGERLKRNGKLIISAGAAPALETASHKLIALDGDQPTRKVLHDARINGFEVLRRVRAEERTRKVPVIVVTSSQAEALSWLTWAPSAFSLTFTTPSLSPWSSAC